MVQFLKCKHSDTLDFLKKLEPELQIFRFAKAACSYADMNEEERQEQLVQHQDGARLYEKGAGHRTVRSSDPG